MSANFKSTLRLFKKHLARFITIIAIVVVSIGFMSGISEVENKLNISLCDYYDSQNIHDLYLKSKNNYGFSANEIEYIEDKFGSENISKTFCYDTEVDNEILRIYSYDLKNSKINKLELLEGKFPETENEVVVERQTTAIKGYDIGDKITIMNKEYSVCGIVLNPLITNKVDEPSFLDSDRSITNVVYINTANIFLTNDIYVTLKNRDLFNAFSSEYETEIENQKAEILNNMGSSNVEVLSLFENVGLYSTRSYGEKVGQIGLIFVVFFLLVTLLVVYSTMSRLLDEERSQIACQKTLGYSNFKIVSKYTFFVLISTVIGGLLAFGVGLALTKLIYSAMEIQYELPAFPITYNFAYYFATFAIILFATTILTFATGMNIVNHKPVTLLTQKAPKAGKKILIERIPFVWNRLSFKYKSTLRNVFLFKSRFFMTVVSVLGSSILVLAGLGLLDNALKTENATSIIAIAIAVIVFSAALCALVVYNLTNINVSERNREIATLMVLGYHDNEVSNYIYREIYIMSFIGAILGVPVGAGFIDFVFNFIDFGSIAEINWWTWILAPIVTMMFSFISTLLLKPKIVKTDMNASLKTIE